MRIACCGPSVLCADFPLATAYAVCHTPVLSPPFLVGRPVRAWGGAVV